MLVSAIPAKFPIIWGASAGGAYIRPIPSISQIGINNGFASLPDGFVPLNATPVASGGIPPFIQDLNGILNQTTANAQWAQAGGPWFYDSGFSTAVGGYPQNAVLASTTLGNYWRSTVNNNTANPDTGGANWVSFFAPVFVAPTFSGTVTSGGALVVQGAFTAGAGSTLQGGATVSGGLTVSGGGANVTGNGSFSGTISAAGGTLTSGLTISAGGLSVTGGLTSANAVTITTGGLTVSAGGASITGTTAVTGAATISTTLSVGSTFTASAAGVTPNGSGWDVDGIYTVFQLKNNNVSTMNPANALITFENPDGNVMQLYYRGTTAAVATLGVGVQATNGELIAFNYRLGNVGNITTNGSTTAYITTSDEELKTFLGVFDPMKALAYMRADPVRAFEWNDQTATPGLFDIGWGAQTSGKLGKKMGIPHMATPGHKKDGKRMRPWGVDKGARTPVIWAVTSWLADERDQMRAEIDELKAMVASLIDKRKPGVI